MTTEYKAELVTDIACFPLPRPKWRLQPEGGADFECSLANGRRMSAEARTEATNYRPVQSSPSATPKRNLFR